MAYIQYGSNDQVDGKGEVKKLQEQLMNLGYDVGATGADGIFGEKTKAALRSYQADQGLNSDGIVGENTYEALYGTFMPAEMRETTPAKPAAPAQTAPAAPVQTAPAAPVQTAPAGADNSNAGALIIQQYLKEQEKQAQEPQTPEPEAQPAGQHYDPSVLQGYLDQWLKSAIEQQKAGIDYATDKAVNDLTRAEQDAAAQFQAQRDQVAVDEAKAKDNQALYAERRGDKGGIGAAQYDAIMANAAKNRLAVSQAQTKLATDTARQIADLRAQGAYEKANALLSLSQQYLSQLVSLEQWAAEFGLSVEQFRASLDEWQKEFALKESDITGIYNGQQTLESQRYQQSQLAEIGQMLLQSAVMPSPTQLQAMGMTEGEAQSIIDAVKLGGGTTQSGLFNAIRASGATTYAEALDYIVTYGGLKSQPDLAREMAELYVSEYVESGNKGKNPYFNQEARAMSSMLQSGDVQGAKERLDYLWTNELIGPEELNSLLPLFESFGVRVAQQKEA